MKSKTTKEGKPKLEKQIRDKLRSQDKARNTGDTYWQWIRQFIRYHGIRHPMEIGESEVAEFLSSLAVDRNLAPGSQDVAFNAISYMYKHVLGRPLNTLTNVVRSRKPKRLPEVFAVDEVTDVFGQLRGWHWLAASLMYGGGIRVDSCMNLRVKDLCFDALQLCVRQPKGRDDYLEVAFESIGRTNETASSQSANGT